MELMRGLAFIALLFAGSAVGAELRQAEVCGDGTTHQAGYCPAVLSSASCSATGATTGSCSATSDEADGTRYVCATSNNTALTGAEIEACSGGAAIAGSSAAETGSNSVSLSGLTTDAAHYGQIVNKSPEQWYSNRLVPASFTPTADALTNASRISALLAGRAPHFSYNTPTDPTTTSTCNAGSASAFNACAAVAGTEITVTGSFSGNLTIAADDIDIVMDNAYTITGNLYLGDGNSRIRWTGGNLNGSITGNAFDSVLFDDFYQTPTGSLTNYASAGGAFSNLAFINSTIAASGDSYAIYAQNPNSGDHDGFIMGNVVITATRTHAHRLMGTHNILIFDYVGNPNATAESALRLHNTCENVWIRDSWSVGRIHMNGTATYNAGRDVINGLFDNFDRYVYSSAGNDRRYATDVGPNLPIPNEGELRNSTLYTDNGAGVLSVNDFDDGGGNVQAVWDETTGDLPSYSGVGAIR